jgi:hypothetical protein
MLEAAACWKLFLRNLAIWYASRYLYGVSPVV